jgi:hypothetical protein
MIPKKLVLELAKGFRGRSKNCISIARERVEKALQYAYRFVNNSNICPNHLHTSNPPDKLHGLLCFIFIRILSNSHLRDRRVRRRDLRSQWIQQINAGTMFRPYFCLIWNSILCFVVIHADLRA